ASCRALPALLSASLRNRCGGEPGLDRAERMCHIVHLTTISVRELHLHAGRYVRRAAEGKTVITDRGRPVALVVPMDPRHIGQPLPDREGTIRKLPRLSVDSTRLISQDRDRA
ncbi:MAG: type II toxin-antitoxin system prevent-host-death family antitoxin, partial [Verrucomicrobiota bacterium]|nr:type II toxin-antitoxin system prevent-host-death family antitoxin [Verrucomicrobiota bacterium]